MDTVELKFLRKYAWGGYTYTVAQSGGPITDFEYFALRETEPLFCLSAKTVTEVAKKAEAAIKIYVDKYSVDTTDFISGSDT